MITHYDMTTGEVITDDSRECITDDPRPAVPALRLMTVDEAVAQERRYAPARTLRITPPPLWVVHLD